MDIEILDEHILFKKGSFLRVRRWLRGIHPELGVIVKGITGWETLVEKEVIKLNAIFFVCEAENAGQRANCTKYGC